MNKLYTLRYLSWIAVICSFIGSILMFIVGIFKTFISINYVFELTNANLPNETHNEAGLANKAIASLVSAVDVFLFALALLIFAYGIYHLFILSKDDEKTKGLPEWMRISSFSELKQILGHIVIIIIFVDFLESIVNLGINWIPLEGIFTPISILLMALALYFLHGKEK